MNGDRRVPTPAEFECAAAPKPAGKFLRFFQRAKRFQVKQGVGEAKDVVQPQRLTWPSREEPVPAIPAQPDPKPRVPEATPPVPTAFERAPAPKPQVSVRRPINISPEVRAQRAATAAAASASTEDQNWAPSWPPGMTEAEIRKRIGRTQNYMEPD